MTRKYFLLTMLMTLLLSSGLAMAQDKTTGEKQTLSDGTFKLVWSKLNVDFRKVVKGAPYSATAVSEHTQTLSDGNQIIRKTAARYYRDGEGRIRTEQKFDNIGNWTSVDNATQLIMIADPVAGRSYTLDPGQRTGRVDPYATSPEVAKMEASVAKVEAEKAKLPAETKDRKAPAESMAAELAAPGAPGASAAPGATAALAAPAASAAPGATAAPGAKAALAAPAAPAAPVKEPAGERTTKESLGRQLIEGIEVVGTRTTRTIPAGEIGNTRPILIVDESWYSPELQLRIMIVHRDPRSGESTFRLTDINRGEPAGTLFEVPPDYRLLKGTPARSIKAGPD